MDTTICFREVASLWKADKKPYVKLSTFSIYSLHLDNHLLPAFGQHTYISETEAQNFVNQLLAANLSVKTVKDIVMILKMILRYAVKHCHWRKTPMELRFPSALLLQKMKVLTLPQQKRLADYLRLHPSPQNIGIAICLATGLRIGEICALKWADFDLSVGVVSISKTIQRLYVKGEGSMLVEGVPKTSASYREIPLSEDLIRILKELKTGKLNNCYFLTGSLRAKEPGNYRRYFKSLLKMLNIPQIHFHGLRHSFATRCIECNCDYKTVSAVLGHSNIQTTLNLYVHPGLEQKRRCIDTASQYLD